MGEGSTPRPVGPLALLSTSPDPAQVQMFTGSLLPTPPLSRSEAPKEKHKKRGTPPFLETTVHLLVLVAFFKNERKKKTANPEHFLEKNYLKLSDPDQLPPSPIPVTPCLECVCVFTPTPLLAAPVWVATLPRPHTAGFQRLFWTTANVTEGLSQGPGPGSINRHVAP